MQVRVGNILYIYTFVGRASGSRNSVTLSPAERQIKAAMEANLRTVMGIKPRDGDEQAKLEKLEQIISSLMGKIHKVPGDRMKGIILDMISKVTAKASSGDLDGALQMAEKTEEFAAKAIKAGERISNATGRLGTLSANLPESGRKMVADLCQKAEKAVNAASEPSELEAIASCLEFAVDVVNTMLGFELGSPGYQMCMRQLQGIMADIDSAVKGGDGLGMPGEMAKDDLALSFQGANQAIDEIRKKTKDAVKQAQLGHLEALLGKLQERAEGLPEGMKEQVKRAINQALADAAAGDVLKAQGVLNEAFGRVDQAAKLNKVVETKLDMGYAVVGRLKGPAKAALHQVLQAADAARKAATSPEQLLAIDAAVLKAIQHGQRPCLNQHDQQIQVRQLQSLCKQFEAMCPQPTFGDELQLAQKPKPAHTKRLGPARTGLLSPNDLPPADGKRDVWHRGQVAVAVAVEVEVAALSPRDLDRIAKQLETRGEKPDAQPTADALPARKQPAGKAAKRGGAKPGGLPPGTRSQTEPAGTRPARAPFPVPPADTRRVASNLRNQ